MNHILVNAREKMNSAALKKQRQAGLIPAIVFGLGKDSTMIEVPRKSFLQWMKAGGGDVVGLKLNGGREIPVMLEDMQRNAVTQEIIHIDFLEVDAEQEVRTRLPLLYTGVPIGTKQGGIVQTEGTWIEVLALPHLIPASFTVDIGGMDIGSTLQAKELSLPAGVHLVSSANEYLVSVIA